MSARLMLKQGEERCGWDTGEQVEVLLEYIENQMSPEAFVDFIETKIAEQVEAESLTQDKN